MQMKKKYQIDKLMIFFSVFLILFIIWSILIKLGVTDNIDNQVISYMIGIRNNDLTNIMNIFTNLGSAYFLISLSIILLFIIKDKSKALLITINLVYTFFISQIFKIIIQRKRPIDIFLTNAIGYSYPSGHTMVSSSFYLFLTYLITNKIRNKLLCFFIWIISLFLIIIIGFTRLYLGVHYLSDVIGGMLLGITCLMIYIKGYNILLRRIK